MRKTTWSIEDKIEHVDYEDDHKMYETTTDSFIRDYVTKDDNQPIAFKLQNYI